MLAFDSTGDESIQSKRKRKPEVIAGDIIISTDAALKNSRIYATALSKEMTLYVIHGILHLLGFDDHTSRDTKRMRKKEQDLLAYLGTRAEKIVH